jgi:hypothetical protein
MSFRRFARNILPKVLAVASAFIPAISYSHLRGDERAQSQVSFPAGYRDWVHVKSAVLGPEFPGYATEGGIHHVYANKTALAGYLGGTFENGSIIVYDLLSLNEKSGVATEGARRRIDVMVKDSKLYAATGGWGFGRFMGDDHDHDIVTTGVSKTCYQCHESQKAHGLVFSALRP